jgi:hypothetical protein
MALCCLSRCPQRIDKGFAHHHLVPNKTSALTTRCIPKYFHQYCVDSLLELTSRVSSPLPPRPTTPTMTNRQPQSSGPSSFLPPFELALHSRFLPIITAKRLVLFPYDPGYESLIFNHFLSSSCVVQKDYMQRGSTHPDYAAGNLEAVSNKVGELCQDLRGPR